jgi:cyclic pyranopterin phosphate synthase
MGNRFYINPCSCCTNSCLFCVRNFADGVFGFDLRLAKDPDPLQLADAVKQTWDDRFEEAVVVGFGEPLLNLEGTLRAVGEVKLIADVPVRINTNGQALLLYPKLEVPALIEEAGVDSVQVSLNAPDRETYDIICRPRLGKQTFDSVLRFAERCARLLALDISAVDLPGLDVAALERLAESMGARFRLRRYHGPQAAVERIANLLYSKTR